MKKYYFHIEKIKLYRWIIVMANISTGVNMLVTYFCTESDEKRLLFGGAVFFFAAWSNAKELRDYINIFSASAYVIVFLFLTIFLNYFADFSAIYGILAIEILACTIILLLIARKKQVKSVKIRKRK